MLLKPFYKTENSEQNIWKLDLRKTKNRPRTMVKFEKFYSGYAAMIQYIQINTFLYYMNRLKN